MKPTLLPLLSLALAAPVLAGDVTVIAEGTVFANSMTSGPLAGAVVGDSFVLSFEVDVPGTPVAPGQYEVYSVDTATFSIQAGGGVLTTTNAVNFALQNDFPVADGARIDFTGLGGGFAFEFGVSDSTGTTFSSTDISANQGVTTGANWNSSQTLYVQGGGGWMDVGFDSLTIGDFALGDLYCDPAQNNSTGQPGEISASGSAVVADNDVTLRATHLPPNQFGYFLNSQVAAVTPFPGGSQGVLCLGGGIGRYNANVASTGNAGVLTLVLDLPNTPVPSGTAPVLAGQTWHFQCWHRDTNPGNTSNFTNALSVTFQ